MKKIRKNLRVYNCSNKKKSWFWKEYGSDNKNVRQTRLTRQPKSEKIFSLFKVNCYALKIEGLGNR